jgi:hypothetical protein
MNQQLSIRKFSAFPLSAFPIFLALSAFAVMSPRQAEQFRSPVQSPKSKVQSLPILNTNRVDVLTSLVQIGGTNFVRTISIYETNAARFVWITNNAALPAPAAHLTVQFTTDWSVKVHNSNPNSQPICTNFPAVVSFTAPMEDPTAAYFEFMLPPRLQTVKVEVDPQPTENIMSRTFTWGIDPDPTNDIWTATIPGDQNATVISGLQSDGTYYFSCFNTGADGQNSLLSNRISYRVLRLEVQPNVFISTQTP